MTVHYPTGSSVSRSGLCSRDGWVTRWGDEMSHSGHVFGISLLTLIPNYATLTCKRLHGLSAVLGQNARVCVGKAGSEL